MPTTYDKTPDEVLHLINETMEKYHPDLTNNGVTVDALFAENSNGDPLKHGGYPALAYVKITNLRNRIKGFADAEITIDRLVWNGLSQDQRASLIDHELHHLQVKTDKDGNTKTDDADRPKLGLKKHDYQFGWFREIAARHGQNSMECYQANMILKNDGLTFFPNK